MQSEDSTDAAGKLETDSRFPSGPWKGFFLQAQIPGKHWMDLRLTFRVGRINGFGLDWVGPFTFRGRYDLESGKCNLWKQYLGRHEVIYAGYNEGKGIWGTWEIPPDFKGGFQIWPECMDDPTNPQLREEIDEPLSVEEFELV